MSEIKDIGLYESGERKNTVGKGEYAAFARTRGGIFGRQAL